MLKSIIFDMLVSLLCSVNLYGNFCLPSESKQFVTWFAYLNRFSDTGSTKHHLLILRTIVDERKFVKNNCLTA